MPTRTAGETLSIVRRRVRREVGDPEVAPDGSTIPVPQRRFTDENIDATINDVLIYMGNEVGLANPGEAVGSYEITYTEAADQEGMALPIANVPWGEHIYQVQDLTSRVNPREVSFVPAREIYEVIEPGTDRTSRMFYTLLGDPSEEASAPAGRIVIRPNAAGKTFRIKYVTLPFVAVDDSDTVPLSPRWAELIGKYAAQRLRAINGDEEPPMDTITRALEIQFKKIMARNGNKTKIQRIGQRWR